MLILDFFKWWYGLGWKLRSKKLVINVNNWLDYFSIGTLLKTIVSPWRQTVTVARADQPINAKFNALVDNLVSRTVGFFVRLIVLVMGVFTIIIVLILNVLYLIIWPLLPASPPLILLMGAAL